MKILGMKIQTGKQVNKKMRRTYRNKTIVLLMAIVIMIAGCGKEQIQNIENINNDGKTEKTIQNSEKEIIKVDFNQKFLNISGKSAEETVEEIKNGGNCLDIYENEDGTVTVEINKEQQEYWMDSRGTMMEELQEQLQEYAQNYRLEHNDSFTEINAYYNQELPWDKAGVYVMYAEFLCASYQLFSGVNSNEWKVVINVYNSDTGKLVKTGDSDVDLTYDNSDWEASK